MFIRPTEISNLVYDKRSLWLLYGNDDTATEANLGDDCYRFIVDPDGIVRIEKWNL
jgi:hypothetical protein